MTDLRQLMTDLAKRRRQHGLTQIDVARKMGTSQSYVARLETASLDPRVSTLLRYAAAIAAGAAVYAALKETLRDPGVGRPG